MRNRLNNWHRWLVIAIGGYDPVAVKQLIYRANTLASCVPLIKAKQGSYTLDVMRSQVKGVQQATITLDPNYARVRGYYKDGE